MFAILNVSLTATMGMLAAFRQPLRVPTDLSSLLWAMPICLSIALIYKAIKVEQFQVRLFAREVALLFGTIIGFLVMVALGLLVVARLMV